MDRFGKAERLRHALLGALTACALVLTILLSVSIHDRALEERLVNRVTAILRETNDTKTAGEVRNLTAVAKPIYEWLENGRNGVNDTKAK